MLQLYHLKQLTAQEFGGLVFKPNGEATTGTGGRSQEPACWWSGTLVVLSTPLGNVATTSVLDTSPLKVCMNG